MENKGNNIKHPAHYAEGRKFEPKDVIRDWGLNFNLGSAVKYVARAGRKDDVVQDLKKAQEFIQFEIDAIEAERAKEVKPKAPNHLGYNSPTPNGGCSNCMECKDCVDAYTQVSPHCGNYGGRKVGVIKLEVPKEIPPEQIIQMVIKKLYGAEE